MCWHYVTNIRGNISRCGEHSDDGCGCIQPKIKLEGFSTIKATFEYQDSETGDKSLQETELTPEFILKQAAPILENAHAWYATVIEQLIQAGDHVLVLCRVIDLAAFPEKNPLIYYQGYKNIT